MGKKRLRRSALEEAVARESWPALPRILSGSQLKVLLRMMRPGTRLTAAELVEETGLSYKTVRKALSELEDVEMVVRTGRATGWEMAPMGWAETWSLLKWILGVGAAGEVDEGLPTYFRGEITLHNILTVRAKILDRRGESTIADASDSRKMLANRRYDELPYGRLSRQEMEKLPCRLSDQINHDQKTASRKFAERGRKNWETHDEEAARDGRGHGELEALAAVLRQIRIREPSRSQILTQERLAVVVAHYWDTLGKTTIRNPNGLIINNLKKGITPDGAYLEFAEAWLSLDEQAYDAYVKASFLALGAEEFWRAWGLSPEAREVHGRVRRHGGLRLFDAMQRPIVAGARGTRDLAE